MLAYAHSDVPRELSFWFEVVYHPVPVSVAWLTAGQCNHECRSCQGKAGAGQAGHGKATGVSMQAFFRVA